MNAATTYPPRTAAHELARDVEAAGGVEAVAERLGVSPEFVRECLIGEREWPEWAYTTLGDSINPPAPR